MEKIEVPVLLVGNKDRKAVQNIHKILKTISIAKTETVDRGEGIKDFFDRHNLGIMYISGKVGMSNVIKELTMLDDRDKLEYFKFFIIDMEKNSELFGKLKKLGIDDIYSPSLPFGKISESINTTVRELDFGYRRAKRNQSAAEKNTPSAPSTPDSKKIVYTAPLTNLDDCWYLDEKVPPKKVMGKWMVSLEGPGPANAKWKQSEQPSENLPDGEFAWILESNSSNFEQFSTTRGAWIFTGLKPNFVQNKWVFTGSSPQLLHASSTEKPEIKFKQNSSGVMTLAKNSQRAEELRENFLASQFKSQEESTTLPNIPPPAPSSAEPPVTKSKGAKSSAFENTTLIRGSDQYLQKLKFLPGDEQKFIKALRGHIRSKNLAKSPDSLERKVNVLVVDDDENLRGLIEKKLEKLGCDCTYSLQSQEFIGILKSGEGGEVCLIDINVQAENEGIILAKAIRKVMGSNIPLILMSAKHDETTRNAVVEVGADDFLKKPFSNEDFFSKLSPFVSGVRGELTNYLEKLNKVPIVPTKRNPKSCMLLTSNEYVSEYFKKEMEEFKGDLIISSDPVDYISKLRIHWPSLCIIDTDNHHKGQGTLVATAIKTSFADYFQILLVTEKSYDISLTNMFQINKSIEIKDLEQKLHQTLDECFNKK